MNVLTKEEKKRLLQNLEDTVEHIEKEVAFSWDGTNLLVRFPKEIAEYFKIDKHNRFMKKLKFIVENKEGVIKKEFEIVERKGEKNATTTEKKTRKNK
ncbi:MAG: hypothetical protein AABW75_03115 [Nanoarchaeota archaeon]